MASPRGGGYVGLGRRAAPASPSRRMRPPLSAPTPRDSPEEKSSNPQSPGKNGTRAIIISGCTGKYNLINDTYEPLEMLHQNKPCWKARGDAPIYLFHTGKSRWVISKHLNDGARCYAYVTDQGALDPSLCPGPWMCCDEKGEWSKDGGIKCRTAEASNDQFTLLRNQVESDLAHYGLMDDSSLKQMWKKLDVNGDNEVSLAEIEALVTDMTKAGLWPDWLNNKDSIRRAFEKSAVVESGGADDAVEKEEFHALLLNLFWFGHLHQIFESFDSSQDGLLSQAEFTDGMNQLGVRLSASEVQREFASMKVDQQGLVAFSEFCAYVRQRVNHEEKKDFSAGRVSKVGAREAMKKSHGEAATHEHVVQQKTMADFDKLEKQIKDMIKANDQEKLRKMWKRLDFNGNNIVSLAEVDKMVAEQYPLLNHKPALMRAFKATLGAGNGDDWVQKNEFKMLLGNLFYFNKLFWLFDQVDEDHDRRMDLKEFQWCMSMCGLKMSQAKSEAEFKKIDANGGGIVLFDEFCRYFTDRECPEAMQDFVDHL